MPRNLRFTDHLEAGLFPLSLSLSQSSTPKITNPAPKPARHPTALGCMGCANALLGARVGSRCVGHRPSRVFLVHLFGLGLGALCDV